MAELVSKYQKIQGEPRSSPLRLLIDFSAVHANISMLGNKNRLHTLITELCRNIYTKLGKFVQFQTRQPSFTVYSARTTLDGLQANCLGIIEKYGCLPSSDLNLLNSQSEMP